MQVSIHPKYKAVSVSCSCGHAFSVRSTYGKSELQLEICSKCHPFYTGKHKLIDTTGIVENYRNKTAGFTEGLLGLDD